MSTPHAYLKELEVATLAVKRASLLTKHLSDTIVQTAKSGTLTKDDKSPVTVGDFALQAIINNAIKSNFPDDEIVGEEDSLELRENGDLAAETAEYGDVVGTLTSPDEIYRSIDFGDSKGDQFAVCLALIEDGQVVLGVIGCPNLAQHIVSNKEHSGVVGGLYSAIKGVGSYYSELFTSGDPRELKVVEGVEKGHSSHSTQAQIKAQLGFDPETVAQQTINLDSQVKYCVLASGQADIYLRLPISDTYREKIWDHAAGNVLVYEAGGQLLDFGKGRTLDSQGVIAANREIFPKVIEAVKEVTN
ncbi:3'(2'),5'-bisphosphate nucleotidase 1 [Candida viswanathii]|uniref:3'(2'),5'-bisphosphate nucleotidase 1 n=1 Tax=Candida viswanathii TaxID=5486 RepID=A0A367XXH0_9ASCO|nr:3'(2'),5'-bisphosphate nucleotidase 1 [Candida viswanathii]